VPFKDDKPINAVILLFQTISDLAVLPIKKTCTVCHVAGYKKRITRKFPFFITLRTTNRRYYQF